MFKFISSLSARRQGSGAVVPASAALDKEHLPRPDNRRGRSCEEIWFLRRSTAGPVNSKQHLLMLPWSSGVRPYKDEVQKVLRPATSAAPTFKYGNFCQRPVPDSTISIRLEGTTIQSEQWDNNRPTVDVVVVSKDLQMGQQTVPQSGDQSVLQTSTPIRDELPMNVSRAEPFSLPLPVPVNF